MGTMKAVLAVTLSGLMAGVMSACATHARPADASAAQQGIFETNVTNNMNLFSGEPEITIDRNNPRNLAIVEFTMGSDERPVWAYNPFTGAKTLEEADASLKHLARVMLSSDGGNTWHARPAPAFDPDHAPGGGDPMIESGPDSTLYVAAEPFPRNPGERGDMNKYTFVLAASRDWGKSFGPPQQVGTPVDRPFLKVDQSTGMVYTASSGTIDPESKALNKRAPGAIMDRWLVAWKPHLTGHSEPRRMGGPDFSAASGNTFVAAHGVVASTFVIGAPFPGGGPGSTKPVEIPASLRGAVKDGTQTCSVTEPCLFFQTSADDGLHWTRHHVPVAGGFSGFLTYVAADEGRPGRYAIGMLTRDSTGIRVMVTRDSGETWSPPATVVSAPAADTSADDPKASPIATLSRGTITKPWMAYGPSGVLGFIWKQRRDDVKGPPTPPQSPLVVWGPGFDVYAAISCDGGTTWLPPLRVNGETSPNGPAGQDDLSYIALDQHDAHLVWGDRRFIAKISNVPMGQGGVQAFYGRVPFAAASRGAQCGRNR